MAHMSFFRSRTLVVAIAAVSAVALFASMAAMFICVHLSSSDVSHPLRPLPSPC